MFIARALLPLLVVLSACQTGASSGADPRPPRQTLDPACDPAYAEDFALWRKERESALADPGGYLGLSGLFWLKQGENTLGSDPACDLVLPAERALPHVGVIHLEGDLATLHVEPGVFVTHDGQRVQDMALQSDSVSRATRLQLGELSFKLIDRAGRIGLRLADPESPILAAYTHTSTWPPRDAWRLPARFVANAIPRVVSVPNVLGTSYEEESPGRLRFELDGQVHELTVTGGNSSSLFVIFGDASNGRGSYSGGRFLRVALPDEQGETVIDFNRAYNPPCAYSPFTTCPLPPEGNVLPFAVLAGEQAWHD